jgi:hypothetical protein
VNQNIKPYKLKTADHRPESRQLKERSVGIMSKDMCVSSCASAMACVSAMASGCSKNTVFNNGQSISHNLECNICSGFDYLSPLYGNFSTIMVRAK